MSQLEFRSLWSPPLKNLSASFEPGVHVLLGGEADGSAELIDLCAGVRLPHRGHLLLDGENPGSSPRARRRIASLLSAESWRAPASLDVRAWLTQLGQLRGFDAVPAAARLCPELELGRALAGLSGTERRALALAAALAQPEPQLVVLHEPLATAPPGVRQAASERIAELGERAPVLVATSSVATARLLGGRLLVLERGVLVRGPDDAWPASLTPGLGSELWVECDAPRRLLAELAQNPDVRSASFDAARGSRLHIAGRDLEGLSLAVSRGVLAADVQLWALQVAAPDLEAVHGASAGLAHAAYHAARESRR